jgi:hypothetical protein
MGSPFTRVEVDGYNNNPPSDDGSQTPENKITWAKVKEKLGDPLKTSIENTNVNLLAAFGIVAGGVSEQDSDYTIIADDQGKLVAMTAGDEVTLPLAADVGSPFPISILNLTGGDLTLSASGLNKIDGESFLTIPDKMGVAIDTNGQNWFSKGQNYKQTYDGPTDLVRQPEGYLTLMSGTPSITSDVTAATSVYYTPDVGAKAPFSDGSDIVMEEFSQMTLSLHSNHIAGAIYDVFLFKESGVQLIGTGPAWNTATAGSCDRGTGGGTTELERWKGFLVNKHSMNVRNGASTYSIADREGIYLGSIYMDGSNGQISCHRSWGQNRKWGVWNYYNRKHIALKAGDSTSSWTYNSTTIRQSRANSGNKLTVFCGVAEEMIDVTFYQNLTTNNNGDDFSNGIGWNATNAFSGLTGRAAGAGGSTCVARHINAPSLGVNVVNCCERAIDGTIEGIRGGEDDMLLLATWNG